MNKDLIANTQPQNLEEAVQTLHDAMDEELKKVFLGKDSIRLHLTLGMFIRNQWGLWQEDTPLRTWFKNRGIEHPDAMSGEIFRALEKKLNDEPYTPPSL